MSHLSELTSLYLSVYGESAQPHLDALISLMESAKQQRSASLKQFDQTSRDWYFSSSMVGMTLYSDLFAGSLKQLASKIDYFEDLGVSFIHLMPLLKPREGENDGGYAVEDYRNIDPRLGSMSDFTKLLSQFRAHNINVCIDYVINHVAKEHVWAQAALNGDEQKQAYFIMYDSEDIPKQFNRTVPEVLPEKAPGNFTYYPDIKKHVFTSFSEFQWDLNFKNPEVFNEMSDILLYLANLGVNMIRLDAIPFMWKELGTSCRNLAPIHDLMRMLHLIKEEVCPSLALLGEAIVEPEEIVKYFGTHQKTECEVMYNANLMVNIYNAFAARDTRLITIDANRFQIPQRGTWMNYVRCHDDIGWGFNEEAVRSFGLDPSAHKQFLINFYGDQFPHSFAKGEMYQYNPVTRDARTNGTLASLLGLEKALDSKQAYRRFEALQRIHLAHALILTYRGFPLIYSGDEIATLNDQSYLKDSNKAREGRWVHRPFFNWKRATKRNQAGTVENEVYQTLKRLIQLRKKLPFLSGTASQFALDLGTKEVLCLVRQHRNSNFFAFFNFSEVTQNVSLDQVRQLAQSAVYKDLNQDRFIHMNAAHLELAPYEFLWCVKQT